MYYVYARVSTNTQKIDRQIIELINFGIDEKNIYIDKLSGKDFKRTKYQKLKRKLKKGDCLIIKSIDRLGRNYDMILEEWKDITKKIQADIVVLDMSLLDTRINDKNLIGRFVSDIVLQILSFVSENERNNIRSRQAEGIALAKVKGIKFGRPKITLPDCFSNVSENYKNGKITIKEALLLTNMKRATFYKYSKMYK